jgi:hypothetical protein
LDQAQPGVWTASVPIAPGSHQVSIRIDGGAWIAPPGVPTVADEFKGAVGIIVIR